MKAGVACLYSAQAGPKRAAVSRSSSTARRQYGTTSTGNIARVSSVGH